MNSNYNQKKLWAKEWDKKDLIKVNNFARRSFSVIKKHPQLKTLLDLGCGSGQDSIYFAKKGLLVTATDFSKNSLDKIPKNIKNLKTIYKDTSKLNFKDNSFDIIYAHLSLHYFNDKDTTQIFNKLYNILNKNGLIFIKCKSTGDDLYGKGKKISPDMYSLNNHVRHFFSKDYMESKLNKYHIIKIRKTSSVYHSYKSSFIEVVASKKVKK